jgi:hypothetical protein
MELDKKTGLHEDIDPTILVDEYGKTVDIKLAWEGALSANSAYDSSVERGDKPSAEYLEHEAERGEFLEIRHRVEKRLPEATNLAIKEQVLKIAVKAFRERIKRARKNIFHTNNKRALEIKGSFESLIASWEEEEDSHKQD